MGENNMKSFVGIPKKVIEFLYDQDKEKVFEVKE